MKYCPYCGASIASIDGAVSFCTECGKKIVSSTPTTSPDGKVDEKKATQDSLKTTNRQKKKTVPKTPPFPSSEPIPRETDTADSDYDGYYDDILPSDIGRQHEGLDKELLKKILAVVGGLVLTVLLCVAAMYLL